MRLKIGQVLKPQGIRGEIKVKSHFDNAEDYKKIKTLEIRGRVYTVSSCRVSGEFVYLKLVGIDSIEMAEPLRNAYVEIDRATAPKLEDGRYYIDDLIGMDVEVDGAIVGVLNEIMQYGAADIYCVKGEHDFSFPALKVVIKSIGNTIVLDSAELKKVAIYEN